MVVFIALLMLPALAFAEEPQQLTLSTEAEVNDAKVPLGVVVSTNNQDVLLSAQKAEGATPVTFTLYIAPKPPPEAASSAAAAIESSAKIQEHIGAYAPAVQGATAPAFAWVDAARSAAADALDSQLATAGAKVGKAQGAYDEREEGELPDTVSGFWLALWTIYFYVLTVLRFLIGNAALFYPVFAVVVLYLIYKTFRRFGRR